MAERQIFPEWRRQNSQTKYPFSLRATLKNDEGLIITPGVFADASLYPVGGAVGMYLSTVVIDHQNVTLHIGDSNLPDLASGSFALIDPPRLVSLTDGFGRPAGVIVSDPLQFGIFQSWGVGTHEFSPDETEFAATVCVPTPQDGVLAVRLPDGTVMTGDVWLVGEDGVVVRQDITPIVTGCGQAVTARAIRIDIVGDPLFRRRLCTPSNLFATPQPIQQLIIRDDQQEFACAPDELGDFRLLTGNSLAFDSILRIRASAQGMIVEAVGSTSR